MVTLELAQPGQEAAALAMIQQGRERLAAQGIDQWQDGYPNLESIQGDIRQQILAANRRIRRWRAIGSAPAPMGPSTGW